MEDFTGHLYLNVYKVATVDKHRRLEFIMFLVSGLGEEKYV